MASKVKAFGIFFVVCFLVVFVWLVVLGFLFVFEEGEFLCVVFFGFFFVCFVSECVCVVVFFFPPYPDNIYPNMFNLFGYIHKYLLMGRGFGLSARNDLIQAVVYEKF